MAGYENMTVQQTREFMGSRKPDEYLLLDVRQPWEYEELHIPGAMLIPLPEVPERLGDIPRDRPVITYCRSGGRSAAAARILAGEGREVVNLVGGASAWQGDAAFGPVDMGLVGIPADSTVEHALAAAYGMEMRLERFYGERVVAAESEDEGELFLTLAGYEDTHKRTIYRLYEKMTGEAVSRETFESMAREAGANLAEGGVEPEVFIQEFGDMFEGLEGIIQLAMMFEAQALDYYSRCARRAQDGDAADAFVHLAREENAHLKLLGKFMDKLGERE
ncbi:rhodanese-like domain-containing protein [Salidesulfovibrio brasiliensis]